MTREVWADLRAGPPHPVHCRFTCDGDHGLFPAPILEFQYLADGQDTWSYAVRRGWLVTAARTLCQGCKGKHPATGDE